LALVGDREAADVEGLAGVTVDPPEHQRGVTDLEVGQAVANGLLDDVSLVAGLMRAAPPDLGQPSEPKGLLTGAIEAIVRMLDVGLLFGELGMLRHRPSRRGQGKSHKGSSNRICRSGQNYGTSASGQNYGTIAT
jgi:hypothetical protein